MPDALVAVVGTGTGVGKTWVTAAVARSLRDRGFAVAARKPAQSHAADDPPETHDAAMLAAATGEAPEAVCPPHRSYAAPMAPPMAASALGLPPLTLAALTSELEWPLRCDVGLVETVGGVRSPVADDADSATLALAASPDLVLLVADAGLGTLNLVRLSVDTLAGLPVLVLLNRFDHSSDLHCRNRDWLVARDALDVVVSTDAVTDRIESLLA